MDEDKRHSQQKWMLPSAIGLGVAALLAVLGLLFRRRARTAPRRPRPPEPVAVLEVDGLTEDEAKARYVEGQDNDLYLRPARPVKQLVHENLLTVLNLNLVALGGAQLLLGKPLDTLLSLGTILLNVILNVGQEMFARRRMRQLEEDTRPRSTVIREAQVYSVEPNEVVEGDMVVIGPGDQIVVDGVVAPKGQLVVDESLLTGTTSRITKKPGDRVYAGSFCHSGRAVSQTLATGDARRIMLHAADRPRPKEEPTPLERIIRGVLLVLLAVVLVGVTFVLMRYFRFDPGVSEDLMADAISVIFNVAPTSLYFMIVVTYASGTADLARLGALVYRSRAVETLAESPVICFAQAGILTGTHVSIEPAESLPGEEPVADARMRQMLGDYARTLSVHSLATRSLDAAFEGSKRETVEQQPFGTVFGWSGIVVDTEDWRGTYVLGNPELLEEKLREAPKDEEAGPEEEGGPIGALRRVTSPVGRVFGRGKGEEEDDDNARGDQPSSGMPAGQALPDGDTIDVPTLAAAVEGSAPGAIAMTAGATVDAHEPDDDAAEGDAEKPGLFRRLAKRATSLVGRDGDEQEEDEPDHVQTTEKAELLLAYTPELVPLSDSQGAALLPDSLIPLCTVRYAEEIRPEAIETMRGFHDTGVATKVFTPGPPERAADALRKVGLAQIEEFNLETITGEVWAKLSRDEKVAAAEQNAIFGQMSPHQAADVVKALRAGGDPVTVIGDGISDLPALRAASLPISQKSSTQAALAASDMVLTGESPTVLLDVLGKGQRIVNGLLDVLKLNLTYVFYLAFLIIAIRIFATGFPYRSAQGTAITITTVALPSVGLTLWAVTGALSQASLGRTLVRFIAPASLTIGATALVVYLIFLDRTGEIAYAQLAVTWTLVTCGLLLVVFVRPPVRRWLRGIAAGDPRPTLMVIFLFALFVVVSAIPLATELLKIAWLPERSDYAIIAVAALAWAAGLRFIWFIFPIEPREPKRA